MFLYKKSINQIKSNTSNTLMPSVQVEGCSSKVVIASLNLPFTWSNDIDGDPENVNLRPLYNHPAWRISRGIDNAVFVGMSAAEKAPLDHLQIVQVDPDVKEKNTVYCKERLWPLLHYNLWDKPLLDVSHEDALYDAYRRVNEAFADRLSGILNPNDRLIIVDYHLLLLPELLKQRNQNQPKVLYIDTPVSSSEYVRCLPKACDVLNGALGANLVIVQSRSSARHCTSCCLRIMGLEKEYSADGSLMIVDAAGQIETSLSVFPLGVDTDHVREVKDSFAVMERLNELRRLYAPGEYKIILGIDTSDHLYGIKHKLMAFKMFLELNRDWIGKVQCFLP